MKKLLLVICLLIGLQSNGQTLLKNYFKYSTFYTSTSSNSSMFVEENYQMSPNDGFLFDITQNHPTDFSFHVGVRKIARFKYQNKGSAFYDGTQDYYGDHATIGAVKGFEYLIDYNIARQQNRLFTHKHFFLRYIGDYAVFKLEKMENGLADVDFFESSVRGRLKIGSKFNVTVGVSGRKHKPYGIKPIHTLMENGGDWWWLDLAYDAGYVDESWFHDTNGNGVLDDGEYSEWGWYGPEGEQVAGSDAEFYKWVFGDIVQGYNESVLDVLPIQTHFSGVVGADFYHYSKKFWAHAWTNVMPYHFNIRNIGNSEYSYKNAIDNKQWLDYSGGVILGTKLNKHIGMFAEGEYYKYWDRNWFNFKVGLNYTFF